MTNGDKLRSMTDEQLANYLVSITEYQESPWSKPTWSTSEGGSYSNQQEAIEQQVRILKRNIF